MNATENASLAARDTQLPGLAFVLSPELLHQRLIEDHAIDVTDKLELVYIRYKPGRRALALLSQCDAEGQRRQLVVSAHDQAAWQKFNSTGQVQEVVESNGMVLSDAQCSVARFPYDRRLHQVAKLFNPARTRTVLERIVGVNPPADIPWQLELLAYKPGRRLVAKASLGTSAWTIKCYTPGDYEASRQRALGVADQKLAAIVPKIVACNDRYCAITSQWIEGDTLTNRLAAIHDWQPLLRQSGELLSHWHIEATQAMKSLTFHHNGFTHQAMLQLADDMKWILPEVRLPVEALLETLEPWLDQLGKGTDIIHGDFYARQIIVEQAQLRLIDFDEVGRGHRYQDLGTFVGQLVWNAIRNESGLEHLDSGIDAFLEGYEQRLGPLDWPLLWASIAAGVLRCLPHPFRRGLPEWAEKTKQILYWASFWLKRAQTSDSSAASSSASADRMPRSSREPAAVHETARYLDPEQVNLNWHRTPGLDAEKASPSRFIAARQLRYKPGRRLVVEYQTEASDGYDPQLIIGKVRLGKSVDSRLHQLHRDLQKLRTARVVVPAFIGEIPEWNLWFQEKLLGQAVSPDSKPEVHRSVGVALAKLHNCGVVIDRSHTLDDELRILRQQHADFLSVTEEWRDASSALLHLAQQSSLTLQPTQSVLLHRDFYFDQVLVMENSIALLDFDTAAMGPAELDVGNYLAHLDESALRMVGETGTYDESAQAFVEGYREVHSSLSESAVETWRFLSLARLVAISQRIADRSHSTEMLMQHMLNSTSGVIV